MRENKDAAVAHIVKQNYVCYQQPKLFKHEVYYRVLGLTIMVVHKHYTGSTVKTSLSLLQVFKESSTPEITIDLLGKTVLFASADQIQVCSLISVCFLISEGRRVDLLL